MSEEIMIPRVEGAFTPLPQVFVHVEALGDGTVDVSLVKEGRSSWLMTLSRERLFVSEELLARRSITVDGLEIPVK